MRITRNTFPYIFLLLIQFTWQQLAHAQCSATINTFPYNEGFEVSSANWVPNITAHWEWGTPVAKTQITTAGGGTKCWIAGGLTGSSYTSGSSELISPCFDFSSLSYPEISFKAFWETELNYDGVVLKYSTNGGTTWSTLGSANSNNTCQGIENWYNNASVNFLSGNAGWSGNVQTGSGQCQFGQGSGQWLTAKHNLSNLAGEPGVIFKFVFGAGTICNGFDGFGLDDIHIGEIAPNTGDFTYTCGANNTAQFTNNHLSCQGSWNWNFGDPASGAANISSAENPSHTFSAPGNYSVSLTVNYSSGPPAIVPPKNLTVVNASTAVTNVKCNGEQNGAITMNVSPAATYNYSWDTSPVQNTAAISGLGPGIYTVTITATNTCNVSVPVTVTEPALLTTAPVASPAKCGNNNGSIAANATGGTTPYFYAWSNSQATPVINGLAAASYDLSVTDINGCVAPAVNNIIVQAVTNNINITLGNNTTICPGQTLVLNPGSYAGYKWQDNSTSPTFTVTHTGTYSVTVTDADGCSGTASIDVIVDCKGIYFPSAFTPNTDPLNPTFGAAGDLGSLKKYSIVIYNRYGQVIFASTDPYKKWDGSFKGKQQDMGSYLWIANYSQGNGPQVIKKGTILIIR